MQCKALRDSAREIQSFDVAYFMASVDTLEENTAFAEEHQAGFPILSDPEKNDERLWRFDGSWFRQALDLLYRRGRHYSQDRQGN